MLRLLNPDLVAQIEVDAAFDVVHRMAELFHALLQSNALGAGELRIIGWPGGTLKQNLARYSYLLRERLHISKRESHCVAHGLRVFTPHMLAVAAKDPAYRGHIVNTASMAGLLNPPNMGVYNATKAAVVSISGTSLKSSTSSRGGVPTRSRTPSTRAVAPKKNAPLM